MPRPVLTQQPHTSVPPWELVPGEGTERDVHQGLVPTGTGCPTAGNGAAWGCEELPAIKIQGKETADRASRI